MAKKRILFIASEIFPYLPSSYISDIGRYLPQGIQEKENEIRTFMPKYGCINERKNLLHEVIRLSGQNIIIADSDHPLIIKVASIQAVRMQIYFIDSEDFFKRKQILRGEDGKFFPDNDARAIFFAKGVIETVCKLGWTPDIIHCHGWITSLVPMFIKTYYKDNPYFEDTRIIYSAYNDSFGEKFSSDFKQTLAQTGIPGDLLTHLQKPTYDSLIKTAFDFSDAAVIGHPDVDNKIKDYLKNYPRPVFVHDINDNAERLYVDKYDSFYDQVMQQTPITF